MIKAFTTHTRHYLPLLGILVAAFLGFYLFSYDSLFMAVIAVSVSSSYVVWGIVHHFIHRDLTMGVLAEYIIFALLGLVIMLSIIYGL